LNPVAESFVRNMKSECLDRMILFGEKHLRYVVGQYVEHYLTERPHRGVVNVRLTNPEADTGEGEIRCRERLGGLLKGYCREAA